MSDPQTTDPTPAPDTFPDDGSPLPPPAFPVQVTDPPGVTPGAEPLVIAADEQPVGPVFIETCPACGHALDAHHAGSCTVMLGAYGTEGACPCPDMPAAAVPTA